MLPIRISSADPAVSISLDVCLKYELTTRLIQSGLVCSKKKAKTSSPATVPSEDTEEGSETETDRAGKKQE